MRSIVAVSFASGQFWNVKDKNEKPHKMYSCYHCFVGGIFFLYLCLRYHIAMKCNGIMRSDLICHGHEQRISEWKHWPEYSGHNWLLRWIAAFLNSLLYFALLCLHQLAKLKENNALSQQLNAVFIYLHVFPHFSFLSLPTIWLRMDLVHVINERYCFVVFAQLVFRRFVFSSFDWCHQIN